MCKGTIKGIVHAGCNTLKNKDDKNKFDVFVYADKFNSPRIQIGEKIAYNVKGKDAVYNANE